jgi:hypothetical protein
MASIFTGLETQAGRNTRATDESVAHWYLGSVRSRVPQTQNTSCIASFVSASDDIPHRPERNGLAWLTPRRTRFAAATLIVAGVLGASVGLSGA